MTLPPWVIRKLGRKEELEEEEGVLQGGTPNSGALLVESAGADLRKWDRFLEPELSY